MTENLLDTDHFFSRNLSGQNEADYSFSQMLRFSVCRDRIILWLRATIIGYYDLESIIMTVHNLLRDSLWHVTGCIWLLAQWAQHPDIRLSIPATRALANLDMDDAPEIKFSSHLHLLHPTMRHVDLSKLDVVFIHGLLGGVFFTWRQRDHEHTSPSILRKYVTF